MRHYSKVMWIILLSPIILLLSSCKSVPHYYNSDDKILVDKAGKGVCANFSYDCVVVSQGTFRNLTTLNPTIKTITVTDCTSCQEAK